MLCFAILYWKAIESITLDHGNDLWQFELSEEEWAIAQEVCDVLNVCDVAVWLCMYVQVDNLLTMWTLHRSWRMQPSTSLVECPTYPLWFWQWIILTLSSQMQLCPAARIIWLFALPLRLPSAHSTSTILLLISPSVIGLPWVSLYFVFYLTMNDLSVLVLHPHHKLAYFEAAGWDQHWIDMAKDLVQEQFESQYAMLPATEDECHGNLESGASHLKSPVSCICHLLYLHSDSLTRFKVLKTSLIIPHLLLPSRGVPSSMNLHCTSAPTQKMFKMQFNGGMRNGRPIHAFTAWCLTISQFQVCDLPWLDCIVVDYLIFVKQLLLMLSASSVVGNLSFLIHKADCPLPQYMPFCALVLGACLDWFGTRMLRWLLNWMKLICR